MNAFAQLSERSIVVAPMGGGPSTPALVIAGTGHRHARDGSAASIVDWLTSTLP